MIALLCHLWLSAQHFVFYCHPVVTLFSLSSSTQNSHFYTPLGYPFALVFIYSTVWISRVCYRLMLWVKSLLSRLQNTWISFQSPQGHWILKQISDNKWINYYWITSMILLSESYFTSRYFWNSQVRWMNNKELHLSHYNLKNDYLNYIWHPSYWKDVTENTDIVQII